MVEGRSLLAVLHPRCLWIIHHSSLKKVDAPSHGCDMNGCEMRIERSSIQRLAICQRTLKLVEIVFTRRPENVRRLFFCPVIGLQCGALGLSLRAGHLLIPPGKLVCDGFEVFVFWLDFCGH